MVREELAHLKKIEWRYMVVDEAHRLKSKDSPLAADLRALQPRHLHLLTGTPLPAEAPNLAYISPQPLTAPLTSPFTLHPHPSS